MSEPRRREKAPSVGERQRVLLARAFVARPTILILDEATANLDFKTEERIKEALERLSHGRTTLLIAHRKSMLRMSTASWCCAMVTSSRTARRRSSSELTAIFAR
jgi:ABC-type multidrug transport system fused ATPase/permease subunit